MIFVKQLPLLTTTVTVNPILVSKFIVNPFEALVEKISMDLAISKTTTYLTTTIHSTHPNL